MPDGLILSVINSDLGLGMTIQMRAKVDLKIYRKEEGKKRETNLNTLWDRPNPIWTRRMVMMIGSINMGEGDVYDMGFLIIAMPGLMPLPRLIKYKQLFIALLGPRG